MAAVLDLSAFAECHEPVAGASGTITGGTKTGDIIHFHEPPHHFVQRTPVADIKLCGIVVRRFRYIVAADAGTGAAADLGNAQRKQPFPYCLTFPCGNDHAGVGDRNANEGTDLGENIVADAVVEIVGVDVLCLFDAGNADGVRTNAVDSFQMLCVHEKPYQLVGIIFQPEQHAQSHVINAACHSTVHGFGVVVVIVLRTGGVKLFIAFLVISFLKEDIRSDAGFFQHVVFFFRGGGDVDIHPPDRSVFVVNVINGVDAFQNVRDRVVQRVFAGFNGKPLVSHVLQRRDLPNNVLLRQLFAGDVLVLGVIGAVGTSVDAVVGQIQRGKNDNTAAVEVQLDLPCQTVHLLCHSIIFTEQQHRRLPMIQPLSPCRLCQNF